MECEQRGAWVPGMPRAFHSRGEGICELSWGAVQVFSRNWKAGRTIQMVQTAS